MDETYYTLLSKIRYSLSHPVEIKTNEGSGLDDFVGFYFCARVSGVNNEVRVCHDFFIIIV